MGSFNRFPGSRGNNDADKQKSIEARKNSAQQKIDRDNARWEKYGNNLREFNRKYDKTIVRAGVKIRELSHRAKTFPNGSTQAKFYEGWAKEIEAGVKRYESKNATLTNIIRKSNYHEFTQEEREIYGDLVHKYQDSNWEQNRNTEMREKAEYLGDLNTIIDAYERSEVREKNYTMDYALQLQDLTNEEYDEQLATLDLVEGTPKGKEMLEEHKAEVFTALEAINKEGSLLYLHRDNPKAQGRIVELLEMREHLLQTALNHFPYDKDLQENFAHVQMMHRNYMQRRNVEARRTPDKKDDVATWNKLKTARIKEVDAPKNIAGKYEAKTVDTLNNSEATPDEKSEAIDLEIAYLENNKLNPQRIKDLKTEKRDLVEEVKSIDIDAMIADLKTVEGSTPENIARCIKECKDAGSFLRKNLKDSERNSLFKELSREYGKLKDWEQAHDKAMDLAKTVARKFKNPEERKAIAGTRIVIVGEQESHIGYVPNGDEDVIAVNVNATPIDVEATIAAAVEGLVEKYALAKKKKAQKGQSI